MDVLATAPATCEFVLSCDALLVFGTWAAVAAAVLAVFVQALFTRRALNAETYARVNERWDSPSMRTRRKRLAKDLIVRKLADIEPGPLNEILGFFEDLGVMVRKNWLARDAVWQSFATAARYYWKAMAPYVADTRRTSRDQTYYSEYEFLVKQLEDEEMSRQKTRRRQDIALTVEALREFLETEASLDV